MKYLFIKENRNQYPVALLCRTLKVSRSGYYKWLVRKTSRRKARQNQLLGLINYHLEKSRFLYGSPRITAAIRRSGITVTKKTIASLMKAGQLQAKTLKRFKPTTKQNPKSIASGNLLNQNFETDTSNKVWTSDITYIWTSEGWLYLTVVMDIFSRKIIGWASGSRISADLVTKALKMALKQRNPTGDLIFHSDRGTQYTSSKLRKILNDYGITQSMNSTGNCYDNAVTESFFHTLKTELTYFQKYNSREQAKRSLFEYIEVFYNRSRLHSSLGYLTPEEFENLV